MMDEAVLHQLLSACISQLDLETIGRMCSSSKAARGLLHGALPAEAPRLLLSAAQRAAEACNESIIQWSRPQKAIAALRWLLRRAPGAAAALDVPALLRIPNMHIVVASPLIEAGLRVSYAQLVAAARDRVKGVQVWVRALAACPERLADSGVPPIVQALVSPSWANQATLAAYNLSPDDPGLPDLLHFVTNSLDERSSFGNNITTRVVERLLSDQLLASQPQLVLELLATAVQQGAETVVRRLLQAPAARTMEPAALATLLQAGAQHSGVLDALLVGLPAAVRLEADAHIAPLLPLVKYDTRWRLYQLPGTQLMGADAIASVLEAGIRAGSLLQLDFTKLIQLPGAAAISSETLARLLLAAVQAAQPVSGLCQLPSFRQLSADGILQVFQAAVNKEHLGYQQSLEPLSHLPAAAGIPPAALEQLVQAAAERGTFGKCETAFVLCGMQQVADQISAPVVGQLMQAAISATHDKLMARASELSGAAGLSSDTVAQLLQAAVSKCNWKSVRKLCQLAAGRSVPADAVQQALSAALAASVPDERPLWYQQTTKPSDCLVPLLKLPGAASIGAAGIVELAQTAIGGGSQQAAAKRLQLVFSLLAAAAVTAAQVQQLLLAAMQQGQCSCMALLLALPGAAALSQEACTTLLQQAADTGYSEYVDELRHLPQAVQQQALVPLLQAAAEANTLKMLRALLKLPGADAAAAAAISVETTVQLLTLAVDSNKPADAQLVCQQLPAAASITRASVVQLLKAALAGRHPSKLVGVLCSLPRLSSLTAADVDGLASSLSEQARSDAAMQGIIRVLRDKAAPAVPAPVPGPAAAAPPAAKRGRGRQSAAAAGPAAPKAPLAKRSRKKR